jgi:SPASM domain peptide maturase of grasp-with-spasm system
LNKKVILNSNCILVKGANRAVICDLQLQQMHFIPMSLYDLLYNHSGKTINQIKECYENKYDDIIDDYLEEKDCVFYTNTPENFPPINLEWDYPSKLSNAIIDVDSSSNFNILNVIDQLNELRCKNIQLRFFCEKEKEEIISILKYIKDKISIIISVELYLKSCEWTTKSTLSNIYSKYQRLTQCIIYNAKSNDITSFGDKNLIYSKQNINSEIHCGKISMQYFSINLKTFTESKHFNSCLNRKIGIDKNGNIKNCPSMQHSYGNVKKTLLNDVINRKNYQDIWNINKDQIETCKDCEYRYVCTDCRAYIETPENIKSKPLKCGYNPYTNEWEKWSDNPLKSKAIKYYGLTEIKQL